MLALLLSKAKRKVHNRLKRDVGRLRAWLLGTEVTNDEFLQSLSDNLADAHKFLDHLTGRKEPKFFLDPTRRQEFVDAIREVCPKAETRVVAVADQVCDHVFDLLGSGPTHLGERIDWHVDFKTGHRFDPDQYYADVRPASYPGGYDIKVPWELSRCQHFTWLGQAYWFSEDEKYAQEFVDQVLDWIEQNPPKFGVNWVCTMDVAIRAVNWLWGYHFFKDSPKLDDDFLLAFFKSLLIHGRHIWRNLENQGDFTSNHYLSNLVGLVYLGILCPEFKEAQRWREFGLQELEKEMFKQVYPDGVDFEASTSYHRLVTELFLSAVILAQKNGHTFSGAFMQRLEKMVEVIMYLTKPDGTVPLIGDHDNGRLHRLKVWGPPEREWVDFRYLLAIGAVLFEREDFARMAGDQWEEAVWLFGEIALALKKEIDRSDVEVQLESRAFPDAGWYLMRHQDHYMFISAGPNGQNGNGGHAHNDSLSFEFCIDKETIIADSGTYIYTADYEQRNLFRSTAYHNVIRVDEEEINYYRRRSLFSLCEETIVKRAWKTNDRFDFFVGQHTGYCKLSDPVSHCRQIFFDKQLGFWLIRDFLSSKKSHRYQLYYHFTTRDLVVDGFDVRVECSDNHSFLLSPFMLPKNTELSLKPGWISSGYGEKKPAPTACYSWTSWGETELVTALIPNKNFDNFNESLYLEKVEETLDQFCQFKEGWICGEQE